MQSLFSPWKRVTAPRTKRWDFEDYASALVVNLMSRVIGVILRLALIVVGRVLQLLLIIFGALFYVSWFFLPLILASLCIYGWVIILNP